MKLIVDTRDQSATKIVSGSSLAILLSGETIQCFDETAQRHVYIGLIRGEIVILLSSPKMTCEDFRNGIATKNVDQSSVVSGAVGLRRVEKGLQTENEEEMKGG